MKDKLETCKNCNHWGNEHDAGGIPPTRGVPDKTYGPRPCGSLKFVRGYCARVDVPYTPDCALVENDEGWGIETGPDFGCIHWQAKGPL